MKRQLSDKDVAAFVGWAQANPRLALAALALAAVLGLAWLYWTPQAGLPDAGRPGDTGGVTEKPPGSDPPDGPTVDPTAGEAPAPTSPAVGRGNYLLCFWNIENLFDDHDDGWTREPDKGFDKWFAGDPEALRQKLDKVCQVFLGLNGGRGPDIIGLAECESYRAAELVQIALNNRLTDKTLHYSEPVYKNPSGGRSIATALITRLDRDKASAKLIGYRHRTLRVTVKTDSKPLIVVVSHWTSRISDKVGTSRAQYAREIHKDFTAAVQKDPGVAYLACGDFNDDPSEPSVTDALHASGDRAAVRAGGADGPLFFNPFAKLFEEGVGSLYYRAKPNLFDQIVLSPGLLAGGAGWGYVDGSAKVIPQIADRAGRPNRFGTEADKRPYSVRGASDHFPVSVELKVGR